jgi:hypothetical protein
LLKATLIGRLNPYGGNKKVIVHDQGTNDIIKSILAAHKIYAGEYDKISDYFWTGDIKSTCQNIWNFLKKNIKYNIESENQQKIMSPTAILTIAKNDCKNYALFINGVLDSLQRKGKFKNKVVYRFASYKLLDEIPHHVFAVAIDDNGNEIWIDPVLPSFDNRKTYFHKIDYNMPLYSISGTQVGLFGSQKAKKAYNKSVEEAKAKGLPAPPPPAKKKIVLKIALAPARGSFLLLVGLNFMGLATKLSKAFADNKDKVNNFWSGLGGNTNELLRKVEQGFKKKRILGYEEEGYIGVAPAALAASAAPILLKVGEFLKSLGIDPQEIVNAGKKVLADQARKAITKVTEKVDKLEEQNTEQLNKAVSTLENKAVVAPVQEMKPKTNFLPFIIAGGVAIYFLTKKKR